MDAATLAGWLLAIGSASFLVGAFNPPLFRVWTAPQGEYLRLIAGHRGAWRATNALFAIATLLTTAGLWLLPAAVGPGGDAIARAAAVAYAVVAALWLGSLAFRLSVTVRVAVDFVERGSMDAAYGPLGEWASALFVAFTLGAGASLVAVGDGVLAGGALPAVAGWFAILIGAMVVVGYLRFGDMPPFVSYLPTGLLGIVILLASR